MSQNASAEAVIFSQHGEPFDTVAVRHADGWKTDHVVARAILRSPLFERLAASRPSTFPVLSAPGRFHVQLQILLASPPSVPNGLALQRVLYEVYGVPTSLIWELEIP